MNVLSPGERPPIISLRGLRRFYGQGAARVHALDGVDLDIAPGEFVAIMGASGSGKSTCMNIIGCLDRPTSGSYHFSGVDVTALDNDGRALLRRNYLGFVFQGFNLLPRTTALENVELPLVYRGMKRAERERRAADALKAVGLEGREDHTAGPELSGGQQQRVAIARAIVTDPLVLLADEPTGNLDSARSHELMKLVTQLNRERGLTIIMVTHEDDIAAYARRKVIFADGQIRSDVVVARMIWESVKLALRTIRRNVLRSILTLLGIVIGVAAVIALVTIGEGAKSRMTSELSKLGSNMLIARPGAPTPGPPTGSDARSFSERDVESLRNGLVGVRAMAASSTKQSKVVYGAASQDTTVPGTEPSYFETQDWAFTSGATFSESDARSGTAVCVIGATLVRELFQGETPLGRTIRVYTMPCEVIGTLASKGQSAFGSDQDNIVVMPLRTYQRRIAGSTRIATIAVSAVSQDVLPAVQAAMTDILRETRRIDPGEEDDFTVRDLTQMAAAMSSTTSIMTGLLGAVAAVSLLVGGIGIMNIMLVSVAERTREIGIRLAIGARANQVLLQFLVEAIVLCLIGGLIGTALGYALAGGGAMLLAIPFSFNATVALVAVLFSAAIGVVFGFFPARSAARLDPIEALRHE